MPSQIFLPSPKLKSFVARYMINVDEHKFSQWKDTEVLPNGTAALGFSFGEPFQYVNWDGSVNSMPCGSVLGIHTAPYSCRRKDPTGMFVVIFRPFALFKLLQHDMDELKNCSTPLDLVGVKEAPFIAEQLRDLPTNRDRVRFIECWLERKLTDCTISPDVADYIANTIIQRKGMVSIRGLERELKINRRYMERNFSLRLGLSPKEFAEVTRFSYISSQFIHRPDISWQELIYLGNFHDQAHLIKHFRKLIKATPEKFRETISASPDAKFVNTLNIIQLMTASFASSYPTSGYTK